MTNKEIIKKTLVNICLSTNQIKVDPKKNTPIFYAQRKKAAEYFKLPAKILSREINTFNKLYEVVIKRGHNNNYS